MKTIQIYFLPNKIKIKSNCTSEAELTQILNTTNTEFENYAIKNKLVEKYDIEYTIKFNNNILKKSIFNTSIKSHYLSLRVKQALIDYEIETVLQLVKLKKGRLKLIKGVGAKAFNEIDNLVKKLGLKLDMSDDEIFIYCEKSRRGKTTDKK